MERIERLIQINAELEGLLLVLARRDNNNIRELIKTRFNQYREGMENLLEEFEYNPIPSQVVEDEPSGHTYEEVKGDEAESSEVEDETDAASAAIERGEEEADDEEIVPIQLGSLSMSETIVDTPQPQTASETEQAEDNADTPATEDNSDENVDEQETKAEENAEPEPESEQQPYSQPLGVANGPETEPDTESERNEESRSEIRVDEMLTRKTAADLKRIFTLNDKFRFRRSLFEQNDEVFVKALDLLADLDDYDAAKRFVVENFGWNLSDPEVEDFMSIIKPHYRH